VFSAVAVNELLHNTGLVRHSRMLVYTMVAAFLVPLWCYYGCRYPAALAGILVFYVALFSELLLAQTKIPFSEAALCMTAGLIIPYLFAALVRMVMMCHGRYFILLPFAAAFLSDIGAYFVGVTMGKHKLCPVISPKKTVEGFVGGVVTAVLGMLLFAFLVQRFCGLQVNYPLALVYGLFGAVAGVMGDLSMSVIKRQAGIKDYGRLIPGHGGILDRFDSVMITAPLTEVLVLIIPFLV
jgi:phosphatidate cytidylyltransferase